MIQDQSTDAASQEETQQSNTEQNIKPEENKERQTVNPSSRRPIRHPDTKIETESETVKKAQVKPYVSLILFPRG